MHAAEEPTPTASAAAAVAEKKKLPPSRNFDAKGAWQGVSEAVASGEVKQVASQGSAHRKKFVVDSAFEMEVANQVRT